MGKFDLSQRSTLQCHFSRNGLLAQKHVQVHFLQVVNGEQFCYSFWYVTTETGLLYFFPVCAWQLMKTSIFKPEICLPRRSLQNPVLFSFSMLTFLIPDYVMASTHQNYLLALQRKSSFSVTRLLSLYYSIEISILMIIIMKNKNYTTFHNWIKGHRSNVQWQNIWR